MSDSEEQKELAARVKDLAWLRAKREKDDLWQLRRSNLFTIVVKLMRHKRYVNS